MGGESWVLWLVGAFTAVVAVTVVGGFANLIRLTWEAMDGR